MPVNLLSEVEVEAVALVKRGANRKTFFLRKETDALDLPRPATPLLKAADWSVVYAIVAEPGWEEEAGRYGDNSVPDRWASEDEIRKAAHGFMRNGGLVNRMHQSLEPYGKVVENAVALADFEVEGQPIRKGSWYIAIEPTAEGREAIERGEFTGVSIQGHGSRDLVEKEGLDDDDWALIEKVSLARSPRKNWIERLPRAMQLAFRRSIIHRAAEHMHFERGMPVGIAIASAINWAKHICRTGDVKQWKGPQQVRPKARAETCAAVALWNTMKATARAQRVSKADGSSENGRRIEEEEMGLVEKIADALGVERDENEIEALEEGDFAPDRKSVV